jgi:hypothetical protein
MPSAAPAPTRSLRMCATVAAVLCLVLLTGCTVTATPNPADPTASPGDLPSQIPVGGNPDLNMLADGTVIATGSFTGAGSAGSGSNVSGTVEITKDWAQLTVRLRDLDLGPSIGPVEGATLELNALDADASAAEFRLAISQFGKGNVVAARLQEFPIAYFGGPITTDPSWMRTALIWQPAEGRALGRLVATAALEWSLPDLRPDLAVADSGRAAQARGSVVYDSAGDPSAYLVAPGDTLDGVAARFSVDLDDLAWLNPMHDYTDIKAGESLNLSRYERGR